MQFNLPLLIYAVDNRGQLECAHVIMHSGWWLLVCIHCIFILTFYRPLTYQHYHKFILLTSGRTLPLEMSDERDEDFNDSELSFVCFARYMNTCGTVSVTDCTML